MGWGVRSFRLSVDRLDSGVRALSARPYLWVPAGCVVIGVLVPLGYLIARAAEAEPVELAALLFRARNAHLLLNTLGLAAGVLVAATAVAFPLAWLVTRTTVWGARLITLLGVLPLAVPGYVMAYALLGATGANGLMTQLMGLYWPRPEGYGGALLALTLYTFPYLFLNLRTALLGLDPALEEAARVLGYRRREVNLRVVLPQLRPAFLAGGLLVVLHVFGDFGVVSLMRFETFSFAIYTQYTAAFDRVYAAWLALMLLALTGSVLAMEARLFRGRLYARKGGKTVRHMHRVPLGRWAVPAYTFIALVGTTGVVLPIATVAFWLGRGAEEAAWGALIEALWDSVRASLPAALLAAGLALPIAYLSVRRPSRVGRWPERVAYLGYATPPLAFALALIVFSLRAMPFLYQTLGLLVGAYALHFLAEALGPIRNALYQVSPEVTRAARGLGLRPLRAFFAVGFPLLQRGVGVSVAFVFSFFPQRASAHVFALATRLQDARNGRMGRGR